MSKTILAFGYIPKEKGGKQTTGLATGIFSLHDTENQLGNGCNTIIAATDIHSEKTKIDNTIVIGWNNKLLLKHIIRYPLRFIFILFKVSILYLRFKELIPFIKTVAKAIFLDYSVEKTHPELIHFHGTSGALLSTCLSKKNHKKTLRIHGINGFDKSIISYKIHRKIEKYITKFSFDIVTFVTTNILKEWSNSYGNFTCEMLPILNGFNPLLFYPTINSTMKKKYDLITISGISERKGQLRVIDAIAKLKDDAININYLIIGSGNADIKNKINNIVSKFGLNVTIIDYLPQKELNAYLHQSKYFILPSLTEGFGQVYIESIGAGIPVIIPEHLPLAKEKGVLNEKNSIFLKDSSVDSITEGLLKIFTTKMEFSNNEVAKTVEKLKWDTIAKVYSQNTKDIG